MINDKSIHRRLEDQPHLISLRMGCLMQYIGKMECHAPYRIHAQVGTMVRSDVAAEELAEMVSTQVFHITIDKVGMDERGKRGQETVGHGLTIDLLDECGEIHLHLLLKLFFYRVRQPMLVKGIDKQFSQDSTAPLIT